MGLEVKKEWHLLPHDSYSIHRLSSALKISPILAQMLLNRGLTDVESASRFLEAPLKGLFPPHQLPGVEKAARILADAVRRGSKIGIYGDYDVDGVTGTAILLQLFRLLDAKCEFYVPNRMEEGYGVNVSALRELARRGVQTLVTVDCGIASLAEAEEARRLGLEYIVTDHHEMKDQLPAAAAIVHPRLPGTSYPFAGLSGAGVAFKLAWAVAQLVAGSEKLPAKLREFLMDSLCLAALGLIADVVPLHDENRIFVRYGLQRFQEKPLLGLKALIGCTKINLEKGLRADDIAYQIAPRLNAAGRLGCALTVVELLTTQSPQRANELASFLDGQNSQRQTIERRIIQQALEMLTSQNLEDLPAIVLADAGWHQGVIGIVAGRLVERLGRPVIILSINEAENLATGSGRSIPGLPLNEALAACSEHLEAYGGHAQAAGLRIRPERIPAFREAFTAYAAKNFVAGKPPKPRIILDAEIPLSALTQGLLDDIDRLEPYGAHNPKPKFLAGNLQIVGTPRRMGDGERHMSFLVSQASTRVRAVAWSMGNRLEELMSDGGRCCLAFTPRLNEWNGIRQVEIEVIDFQPSPQADLV